MSTSLINIIDWSSRFFEKRSTFQIRQGLENAFQNEEFVNTLLVVTFIVAYGMALQIAISLAFRKYLSYNFRKIKAVIEFQSAIDCIDTIFAYCFIVVFMRIVNFLWTLWCTIFLFFLQLLNLLMVSRWKRLYIVYLK